MQAAFVALQSYHLALRSGEGDEIDFAALDGAVQALDPGSGTAAAPRRGSRRRSSRAIAGQEAAIPDPRLCRRSCPELPARRAPVAGHVPPAGEPAAFADPSFNKTAVRYKSGALTEALAGFFATRSRADLEREAAAHGVPLSGLATRAEPPAIAHFVVR